MLAYKREDLENRIIQEEASGAFLAGDISEESYRKILEAKPYTLYIPGYIFKIGMFLLTFIIVITGGGLLFLIFQTDNEAGIRTLLFAEALGTYLLLEYLVQKRGFYNAGVDNALMIAVTVLTAVLFTDFKGFPIEGPVFVSMMVATWLCIRFADAFMGVVAYGLLLILAGRVLMNMKIVYSIPWLLMVASAVTYTAARSLLKDPSFLIYGFYLKVMKIAALAGIYLTVNYAVADICVEGAPVNGYMPALAGSGWEWLYWLFTFVIPPLYLYIAIRKTSIVFMRLGVIFMVVSVFTFRHYHSVLPFEQAAVIAGLLLMGGAWLLIRWLKTPRGGFIFETTEEEAESLKKSRNVIVAQLAGGRALQANTSATLFRGGNSGGGGASGTF